jgi:Family of unknown function (DUF6529)
MPPPRYWHTAPGLIRRTSMTGSSPLSAALAPCEQAGGPCTVIAPGPWQASFPAKDSPNHGKHPSLGMHRRIASHSPQNPPGGWPGSGCSAWGVAAAIYAAGRLVQPDLAFSLFGPDPFASKSLLATIALGLAAAQVLLALWMYRKLPLAPPPAAAGADRAPRYRIRPVRGHRAHRRALPDRLGRAADQPAGGDPLGRRVLLLRGVRRQSAARIQPQAARLGTASSRRHARAHDRRALVHLGTVVLQRLPAAVLVFPRRKSGRYMLPGRRGPLPRSWFR